MTKQVQLWWVVAVALPTIVIATAIGADAYAKDAADTVRIVERLLK